MRLTQKVAIVTGAANGIGFAIAERLIAEGANVLVADIDERAGEVAARKLGSDARFLRCDVTKQDDIDYTVFEACRLFTGDVDVLVNNAALHEAQPLLKFTRESFYRTIEINLLAPILFSQRCAEKMVHQIKAGKEPGTIINIASINSLVALGGSISYCASKGGLLQLTRSCAIALAPFGIRVNAIGPGSISTDSNTERLEIVRRRTPLGRKGTPAEIASIVAFLASRDASYITGEIIYADGGRLALNYTNEHPID